MKRNYQFAMVMALAVAGALPSSAQTSKVYREGNAWVEEISGTMPASRTVRVNTDSGSVSVQGGAQHDITYTVRKKVFAYSEDAARKVFERFRVVAARRAEAAVLEGTWDGGNARKFSADFALQVPRELDLLKVNTDGGSLSVSNIGGKVAAESGGGSVKLSDIAGPISAETGGGSVEVSNATNDLDLRTGGGAISITSSKGPVKASTGGGGIMVGAASQGVDAQTGGGSIEIKTCGADMHAQTGGGNIDVGDVGGRAVMSTGGGSIRLASAKGTVTVSTGAGTVELWKLMQGARVESGAGGITAEFLGGGSTDSLLQTSVGDVVVYLSPQSKFTVRAAIQMANGHSISAKDFPALKITSEGGDWGPRNIYAEGNLNGGGPVLKIRTMSGNIEFRRASR